MNQRHTQIRRLESIAARTYEAIASVYPVCCASDEFYFFPQVLMQEIEWRRWDDFSLPQIQAFADLLCGFERELSALTEEALTVDERLDAELLQQMLRTLREQLVDVAPYRTQPTFHLTILAAGLAEALASSAPGAWQARIAGAPAFLLRASQCLDVVPGQFLELGLQMLSDLQEWVHLLQTEGHDVGDMPGALNSFRASLKEVTTVNDYRLDEGLLDKLIREHIGCGVTIDSLLTILQGELQEMRDILAAEASTLLPGKHWIEAEHHLPFVAAKGNALIEIYRGELDRMESHCRREGLVPEGMPLAGLGVEFVPSTLAAIRASDAYAATPGHPPRGGTFFVMETGRDKNGQPGRTLEYRMTAVHEAWPGHHLLDTSRWSLKRSIRRPIESPLFYEGWACLAEELMARTGYLDGPWDSFLLARRRAERAARGMVDLGLQSGRMTIAGATDLLASVGYRRETARSVVPKYLLRPGYQVCYTLGLKQGLDLLDRFGHGNISRFVQSVLKQGEIGFSRLEKLFCEEVERSQK